MNTNALSLLLRSRRDSSRREHSHNGGVRALRATAEARRGKTGCAQATAPGLSLAYELALSAQIGGVMQ